MVDGVDDGHMCMLVSRCKGLKGHTDRPRQHANCGEVSAMTIAEPISSANYITAMTGCLRCLEDDKLTINKAQDDARKSTNRQKQSTVTSADIYTILMRDCKSRSRQSRL